VEVDGEAAIWKVHAWVRGIHASVCGGHSLASEFCTQVHECHASAHGGQTATRRRAGGSGEAQEHGGGRPVQTGAVITASQPLTAYNH
jgi:hypothetical protein